MKEFPRVLPKRDACFGEFCIEFIPKLNYIYIYIYIIYKKSWIGKRSSKSNRRAIF